MQHEQIDKDGFRDSIGTVDQAGNRLWVYPKKPDGRYYRWRTYVSYVLLIVLFGLPWLRVWGEPLFLFDVLSRKFILFGLSFTPQDFHLFALFMITGMVFIILFTAVFGRLFCGWICPQTIFMEMVFRKIEYWIEGDGNAQKRLAKAPWTRDKVRKKIFKHTLFILVATVIAHTFLAYVIGTDQILNTVTQSPLEAPGGFLAIVVFIALFYGVFAYMREQVCIAICPYGRLQGVLLDRDSINVIYDYERGEPRGKLTKSKPKAKAKRTDCDSCESCRDKGGACGDNSILEDMQASLTGLEPQRLGDCIDCTLCVQVCPTGIDIRNGIQMECVNCTACIDACDAVMDKIDRPRGLIRYDSENGVADRKRHIWTPRVMAYSGLLLALIALNIVLLSGRENLDVLLLRAPGQLYHTEADGTITNLYTYQVVNKTSQELPLEFAIAEGSEARLEMVGSPPVAKPGQVTEGVLFIRWLGDDYPDKVTLTVSSERGTYELTISFLHP